LHVTDWCEPEQAPHWRVLREPCLYIYVLP